MQRATFQKLQAAHVAKVGKTPVLGAAEARELLDSINTNTVVGLRDRALIALLTFTFARIGAALRMNVEDVYWHGRPRESARRQAL
jgi:site-specific recombinase XerD